MIHKRYDHLEEPSMEYKTKETNQEIQKLFPVKGLRISRLSNEIRKYLKCLSVNLFVSFAQFIVASEIISILESLLIKLVNFCRDGWNVLQTSNSGELFCGLPLKPWNDILVAWWKVKYHHNTTSHCLHEYNYYCLPFENVFSQRKCELKNVDWQESSFLVLCRVLFPEHVINCLVQKDIHVQLVYWKILTGW